MPKRPVQDRFATLRKGPLKPVTPTKGSMKPGCKTPHLHTPAGAGCPNCTR